MDKKNQQKMMMHIMLPIDLALALFFLFFGESLLGLDKDTSTLIAGILVVMGFATFFTLRFISNKENHD